jgi:two-component system, response regulator PdtaR
MLTAADRETDGEEELSLRLLEVEDEAMVAMLIEDALTLHGHVVVGVADNQARAIEIAEQDRPDLALCDINLADGDNGLDVAAALGARGIASLFLSGTCPTNVADRHIVGCLPKPFHTGTLGAAVRAAHRVMQGRAPDALPGGMKLY